MLLNKASKIVQVAKRAHRAGERSGLTPKWEYLRDTGVCPDVQGAILQRDRFPLPLIDPDGEAVAEPVHILSKVLHQAQVMGSHLDVDISILVLSASTDLFHLHLFLFPLWNLF